MAQRMRGHGADLRAAGGPRVDATQQYSKTYEKERGSAAKRGYGAAWRKARIGFLASHPLCTACEKIGRVTAATVVDHITPHKGSQALFWEYSNWQALCAVCHNSKTAREDGGYGRKA